MIDVNLSLHSQPEPGPHVLMIPLAHGHDHAQDSRNCSEYIFITVSFNMEWFLIVSRSSPQTKPYLQRDKETLVFFFNDHLLSFTHISVIQGSKSRQNLKLSSKSKLFLSCGASGSQENLRLLCTLTLLTVHTLNHINNLFVGPHSSQNKHTTTERL